MLQPPQKINLTVLSVSCDAADKVFIMFVCGPPQSLVQVQIKVQTQVQVQTQTLVWAVVVVNMVQMLKMVWSPEAPEMQSSTVRVLCFRPSFCCRFQ